MLPRPAPRAPRPAPSALQFRARKRLTRARGRRRSFAAAMPASFLLSGARIAAASGTAFLTAQVASPPLTSSPPARAR